MAVVVVDGFVVVVAREVVVVANKVDVEDEVVVGSDVVVVGVLEVVVGSAVVDVVSATPDSPPPKTTARTNTPNSPTGMKNLGRLQIGPAAVGSAVMTLSNGTNPCQ